MKLKFLSFDQTHQSFLFYSSIAFFILQLLLVVEISAKTTAFYFGTGNEREESQNVFAPTLESFLQLSQQKNWNSLVQFDHQDSLKSAELSKKYNSPIAPFNHTNFLNQLDNLTSILSNPEDKTYQPGDQIMIVLNTHGANQRSGQATHSITTSDGLINLDDTVLPYLLELAKERGLKVALLDLSCYSGYSLKLANSSTCVISAAGYSLSYANTWNDLIQQMKKSSNLEEAFLEFRKKDPSLSSPQISTPTGLSLARFFSSQEHLYTPLNIYTLNKIKSQKFCDQKNKGFQDIKALREFIIQEEAAFNDPLLWQKAQTPQLVKLWNVYQTKMIQYLPLFEKANQSYEAVSKLDQKIKVEGENKEPKFSQIEKELVSLNYKLKNNQLLPDEVQLLKKLNQIEKKESYRKWKATRNSFLKQSAPVNSIAAQVAQSERQLYNELYRSLENSYRGLNFEFKNNRQLSTFQNKSAQDPCADFKL